MSIFKLRNIIIVGILLLIGGVVSFIIFQPKEEIEVVEETTLSTKVEFNSHKELSNEDDTIIVQSLNDEASIIVDTVNENTTTEEVNSMLKESFITFVDFIFYGGEINGKTFSELGDDAKEATLDTFYNLDQFIEGYIPNYKEEVVQIPGEVGSKIVDLAKTGKDNIVLYAEENLEPETIDTITKYKDIVVDTTVDVYEAAKDVVVDGYNAAEPYIDDAKDYVVDKYEDAKPYIEDATDVVVDAWDSAVDALDGWYQDFKNN